MTSFQVHGGRGGEQVRKKRVPEEQGSVFTPLSSLWIPNIPEWSSWDFPSGQDGVTDKKPLRNQCFTKILQMQAVLSEEKQNNRETNTSRLLKRNTHTTQREKERRKEKKSSIRKMYRIVARPQPNSLTLIWSSLQRFSLILERIHTFNNASKQNAAPFWIKEMCDENFQLSRELIFLFINWNSRWKDKAQPIERHALKTFTITKKLPNVTNAYNLLKKKQYSWRIHVFLVKADSI